ncbi:MAG: thiamine phosphate synthase [Gemmatimonadota bacterium]
MIPTLHVITDDEILTREGFVFKAMGVLEAGGEGVVFHLRGPRTSGKVLHSLARVLKGPAEAHGCRLLANDRVDLALALDLSGAHLGQRSLPPGVARRILGPHRLLGLSVHGLTEAGEGLTGIVDFLLAGTIYPSFSHPEGIPEGVPGGGAGGVPGGVARIREIRGISTVPLVAIGGMTPDRVAEVLAAGAHGVAVRGGIWDAGDPTAATRVYLEELEKGSGT